MQLQITHKTTYVYDSPVNYGLQQVRLTPGNDPLQTVVDWSVDVEGGAKELAFTDHHANHTLLVQAKPGQTEVAFVAHGTVNTHDKSGVLGQTYGKAPLWHFLQVTPRTTAGRGIKKLAAPLKSAGNTLDALHTLSRSILDTVPYGKSTTLAETTAEDAVQLGEGVCQDHSQIFIAAARQAGIPARYVSGYLMMNDRVDQDASHAWAEAHIDGLGWVGFDISNGISPDERYVRVATGRDSKEASPISGMRVGGTSESMIVSVQVQQ